MKNPFVTNDNQKTTKYFLIVLLILVVALAYSGAFQKFFIEANAVTYWTDIRSSEYAGGSGTMDDPYQISTAQQLAYLSYQVQNGNEAGAYYSLLNNISLFGYDSTTKYIWSPIGGRELSTKAYPFSGTFFGNGYTISDMYITTTQSYVKHVGLFGNVTGSIQDLHVEGAIKLGSTSYKSVGGIAGQNQGSITKCSANIYISANAESTGGIVGKNTSVIDQCMTSGQVSGSTSNLLGGAYTSTGGIVGYQNGGKITNCYNTATISQGYDAGGIVGNAYWQVEIQDCYNKGTVTGTENIGGIVGKFYDGTQIYNCYNQGQIVGNGGIIGLLTNTTIQTSIQYCYNDVGGKIYYNDASTNFNGGIIGYVYNIQTSVTVTNCYNNEDINAEGGIVGACTSNSATLLIQNCQNKKQIKTKKDFVGGIIGGLDGSFVKDQITNLEIDFCDNLGNITTTNTKTVGSLGQGGIAGAIVGFAKITSCINHQSVYGLLNVGGIIGNWGNFGNSLLGDNTCTAGEISFCISMGDNGNDESNKIIINCGYMNGGGTIGLFAPNVQQGYSTILGCINFCDIYGGNRTDFNGCYGGIVGSMQDEKNQTDRAGSSISYCLNYGDIYVYGNTQSVGGICGQLLSTIKNVANTYYFSSISISGCTNLGKITKYNQSNLWIGSLVGSLDGTSDGFSYNYYCDYSDQKAIGSGRGTGTDQDDPKTKAVSIKNMLSSTFGQYMVGINGDLEKKYYYLSRNNVSEFLKNNFKKSQDIFQTDATNKYFYNGLLIIDPRKDNTSRYEGYISTCKFVFADKMDKSVWASGNVAINGGTPYFKQRYW